MTSAPRPTAETGDWRELVPGVRLLPPPASVMWTKFDLASIGYRSEEFVIAGQARAFADRDTESPLISAEPPEVSGSAAYTTRISVFRPADAQRNSGTAIVEWLNCRDGVDTAPQWIRMHRHIIRSGMIWIGVSAQRAGIEGHPDDDRRRYLKALDGPRYASLDHPGDAYAFDMFSQASAAVRAGAVSFAAPTCILATGSSQAARFLTTYVNRVDSTARTIDGFLLTGRHRSAATLSGESICGGRVPLRAHARVPVFVLQPETDLFGRMQSFEVRQDDTEHIRTWEIAGTAHGDSYMAKVGNIDDGMLDAPTLAAAYTAGSRSWLPLQAQMNSSPALHFVHQAALRHLESWVRIGTQPPTANRLCGDRTTGVARDPLGIALGGVRTPWVDCPAYVYSGDNDENGEFESLFGSTLPLPPGTLESLYPGGRADYLARFASATRSAVDAGFLLEDDFSEILELARALYPQ